MTDDFDSWLSNREHDVVDSSDELLPGTIIGEYRVVALLGRGGFADVYRAVGAANEAVAIKILHRLDDKSRARFTREAEILSQVHHENFPSLLCFGSCGERPYLVTELLREYELPHDDRGVAAFLKQIISAVAELHAHGYVHRDIKPTNILARRDGTPVLIDFGLASPISAAKREQDGLSIEEGRNVAVGTIGYSAPEQFNGLAVGREADVHALGMLIDACFQGKMPKCWQRIYLASTTSKPKSRYRTTDELSKAIKMRHWRGIVISITIVVLVFVLGLLCNEARIWYNIEKQTPHRFIEKGN